jgi:nitrate/nitrite transporter NarK
MCAASAFFAWRWLYQPSLTSSATTQHIALGARVSPLHDRQIWRVVMGIGILCGPQFAVLTFGTVFLHDYVGSDVTTITVTMVLLQLGAMGMRVWSGRLTDRRGNRRAYLRVSVLVAAASFFLMALSLLFSLPAPIIVSEVAIAGICISAWHGVAYTELATMAGAGRAGTALGMVNTGVYASLFVVPLAIPHVLVLTSWSGMWGLAGLCALITYPLFPRRK